MGSLSIKLDMKIPAQVLYNVLKEYVISTEWHEKYFKNLVPWKGAEPKITIDEPPKKLGVRVDVGRDYIITMFDIKELIKITELTVTQKYKTEVTDFERLTFMIEIISYLMFDKGYNYTRTKADFSQPTS